MHRPIVARSLKHFISLPFLHWYSTFSFHLDTYSNPRSSFCHCSKQHPRLDECIRCCGPPWTLTHNPSASRTRILQIPTGRSRILGYGEYRTVLVFDQFIVPDGTTLYVYREDAEIRVLGLVQRCSHPIVDCGSIAFLRCTVQLFRSYLVSVLSYTRFENPGRT